MSFGNDNKEKRHKTIYPLIDCSRAVQEGLWEGESLRTRDLDVWIPILEKRINKLKQIDTSIPNSEVEVRKRILQLAALSIKYLEL